MQTKLVVVLSPGRCFGSGVLQIRGTVYARAAIPESVVEGLDVRVVCWCARSRNIRFDLMKHTMCQ